MSVWSVISYKLKEILRNMIGARTIEQTLHIAPVISSQMEHAIQLWDSMYKNESPWLHEPSDVDPTRVVSLGLPSLIASEKARMALLEMKTEITGVVNDDGIAQSNDRADYMESQYKDKLIKNLRREIEYGIAKGGLVIKPYVIQNDTPVETSMNKGNSNDTIVNNTTIEFDFIQADCFYPLAFDASGKITEAAFVQTLVEKDTTYRRLEYHKWEKNTIKVVNKAFKSVTNTVGAGMSGIDLGQEVPLTSIAEWKDIQPETTIQNASGPLFAYFKMPEANTVDLTSPLGVSGYSRAIQLIKDADMQYSRLLWEYEAGEMAIDIDRDALEFMSTGKDRNGKPTGRSVLNSLQARLYRKIDLGESDTYNPYAPTLRDAAFIQGLNTILMRIEDVTGLSRGTLSDAAAEARTATELKILKQRSYQTNADIQSAIEDVLKDVVQIMDMWCDLYDITPKGEYNVSFEWDDSIIVDIDTEMTRRMMLMQDGIVSKLENRMWYFGETEEQAREALEKVEKEALQSAQNNMEPFDNEQLGGGEI